LLTIAVTAAGIGFVALLTDARAQRFVVLDVQRRVARRGYYERHGFTRGSGEQRHTGATPRSRWWRP
jgi:hypothetical protein